MLSMLSKSHLYHLQTFLSNQKLSDLKVSLQKQFDEQYLESKTRTEKQLENLNEDFEKKHSKMAINLFNRIIEV